MQNPFCFLADNTKEPATGTKLGEVADCDLDDFKTAIHSAHQAQKTFFSSTTGTSRGALLRKWYDLILANQDDSMHPQPNSNDTTADSSSRNYSQS